eukprot:XP_011440060.1 PREDICTED: uncharacterized protein LOC105337153 isoform X2 [Crassostrea gigas]
MFHRHHLFVMVSACWIVHYLLILTAISQSEAFTWFEAQTECREKNQSLTLWKNKSTSFYWTGFYKTRSHWIKIIGCYNSSGIHTVENKEIELSISSPPLCQEHCLQDKRNWFAVQNNTCVCLSDGFDSSTNQLASSNCTYRCTSGGLLSTECGGKSAFNVFLTDKTNLTVKSRCLALQCGSDRKFLNYACITSLPTICSSFEVDDTTSNKWMEKKKYCKAKGNYPIGNLTLSNIKMACTESNYNITSPRWIGVIHEVTMTEDQGQLITKSNQILVKRCLKCHFNDSTQQPQCENEFCDVDLKNKIYCSKEDFTTPQPDNADSRNSETTRISSTSLYETTSILSIDSEKIGSKGGVIIIVPVVIAILLLSVFLVATVLYIRRKKQMQEKSAVGGRSPQINGSKNYSNVENQTENNYFVLQKSNPSYELAGECIVGSESPYNEAEDGTYDNLGNKDARKAPAEDIYNHTSSAELSDLSDYDVTNHKHLNEEDSTYDHAGVGDSSYGHFDLHPIKETDYSMLS